MKKLFGLILALACCINASAVELFLVGDATPVKWVTEQDANRSRELTEVSPGVFEWVGKLVAGGEGFKVSTSVGDWGNWHPSAAGFQINGATDTMVEGGDDTKWTISEDGVYKVTIVWDTKTISCEKYDFSFEPNADGVYEIDGTEAMAKFILGWNGGAIPQNANAVLTADIDLTAEAYKHSMIGLTRKYAYAGVFDGQGHTVKINLVDRISRTALFGYINGATIKNLHVAGNITMTSRNCAGGIFGRSDGSNMIENCVSSVTITDNQNGDGTHGGLAADTENGTNFHGCAFYGSINAPSRDGNGALVGYVHAGANVVFENCIVAPVSIVWKDGATIGRNFPTIVNCYATDAVPANGFTYASGAVVNALTAEDMKNPEFIYTKLNANSSAPWNFTIGEDEAVWPFSTHKAIYANGALNCDGTAKGDVSYSNENNSAQDPHAFENGVCGACGHNEVPALADGFYQIANGGNLCAFAELVNSGNAGANAVLTADIDLSGLAYTPIGNDGNRYRGFFNGQGHRIMNMVIDGQGYNESGMFAVVTGGAKVKGVIIDKSCLINGNGKLAAIAGAANGTDHGDWIHIEDCGNEADITGSGANCAAFVACNYHGGLKIRIVNSYNTGNIKGSHECAAFSGWLGSDQSIIQNCWNTGNVEGIDNISTLARCIKDENFSATFDLGNADHDKIASTVLADATAESASNGHLAFAINKAAGKNVWYQTVGPDTHPVLDASFGVVGQENGSVYGNAATVETGEDKYATYYNSTVAYVMPENCAGYIVYINPEEGKWTLEEAYAAGEVVPAGTPLVIKAAEASATCTLAYVVADDAAKAAPEYSALHGTDVDAQLEADETSYFFVESYGESMMPEKVGFYWANELGSEFENKANTAYAKIAKAEFFNEGVAKGFAFDNDGEATGITSVDADAADGVIYNVAGQRVSSSAKGILIKNGRKYINR